MNKYLHFLLIIFIFIILNITNLFAADAIIKWKYVNLRETASKSATIVTKLTKGTAISVVREEDGWYKYRKKKKISFKWVNGMIWLYLSRETG